MDDANPIVRLLRLSIVLGQAGPWAELLGALDDLVVGTFRGSAPPHQSHLAGEFQAWLPGWLMEGQRLESAHAWLEGKVQDGSCPAADDQERALRGYLQQAVRSGVGDFFRERSGRSAGARSQLPLRDEAAEALQARPDRISAADQERLSQLRQHLDGLPPSLRVPFRLRYYGACGPLPPEDLRWAAEQSGLPAEEVQSRVQAELQAHQGAEFPLGADFIGALLHIPPAADGRFTTVDQRVSRARQRLRELLTPEDESR
jgi:DNA-directed RNA polymerase specialized sigma24 family protein